MSTLDRNTLSPKYDGITHINISYMATTKLGRLLNDSSDLLVDYLPHDNNPDGKTYYFTAYAWFAFCMTGNIRKRDLSLAGSNSDYVRKYLQENKVVWSRENVSLYKAGLIRRVDRPDVNDLLKINDLPIVSYIMIDNKYQFRSNDKHLVRVYNKISETLLN